MTDLRDLPAGPLALTTGGSAFFFLLLTVTGGLQAHEWAGLHAFASGYVLAFVCGLSVLMLWAMVSGRVGDLLNARPWLLWLAYFPAALIFMTGLVNLLADIAVSAWLYQLGWILAVLVLVAGPTRLLRSQPDKGDAAAAC